MKANTIIIAAICMHLFYGLSMLLAGTITMTTGIAPIALFTDGFAMWTFIFSAAMAISALRTKNILHSGLMLIPQFFIMMYSFGSSIYNIFRGQYSDGFIPMANANGEVVMASKVFIANDQILFLVFTVLYCRVISIYFIRITNRNG